MYNTYIGLLSRRKENMATEQLKKSSQFASQFNKLSEAYEKRYPRLMNALKNESILSKHGTVNEANIAQLGAMIDKTRTYLKYKNEQGTVSDLGLAAKFAIDLVTVGYTGAAPALMANIQQLRSQKGYVWYEATKAETNAGNVTKGQALDNALAKPDVYARNYGVPVTNEKIGETDGSATLVLNGVLTRVPIRPRSVTVNVNALEGGYPITGTDSYGNGDGYGNGLTFKVDYQTGNLAITFTGTTPPESGKQVYVTYDFEAENPSAIPEINIDLQTKPVEAQVCALQAEVGLLKQYEMQSVLGIDAATRTAQKLAEELNREISTKLVDLAEQGANAGKAATWVKNPNYQVGLDVQHQQSLDYAIVDMDGEIFDRADRGNVTTLVGSRKGVLEPYKIIPLKDRTDTPAQQGTSLVGTYGNKPLIRAASLEDADPTNPNVIGKLLGIYRGAYPWDAGLVIGVHMPIISIKDIPNAEKILLTKQGIATWAAFTKISDAFFAKCNILNNEGTEPTT